MVKVSTDLGNASSLTVVLNATFASLNSVDFPVVSCCVENHFPTLDTWNSDCNISPF
jgi:hypothetical protein